VTDEDVTARLVRLGGMRPDVPADREARVKQAFLQEVRVASRARTTRRQIAVLMSALSLAAAVLLAARVWPAREDVTADDAVAVAPDSLASVERVEGNARLALGQAVRIGDRIETGNTARIGLRLAGGESLRFDRGARARLVSRDRIELDVGTLYIDTGSDRGATRASSTASSSLEITTPFGVVKDIGTQFEVRLSSASVRVRVRSGVVQVHRGAELTIARPGTELTVTSAQTATRSVEAYGEEWAWAVGLAPDFPIDGRSLGAFLEYVCREQGWTLVYADPRLALESSGMILHGPTHGVPLADALSIVLPTTGLTYRLDNGTLTIARDDRP
jgi:ferric-dicitrate binding protein FerR (iron transport regulator)